MNPDMRSATLATAIREKFKALIDLPLETAGPAEVNKWFTDQGMDAATTRKAKSFFMAAAKENGIKMHSLVADRVSRRGPSGPRKKRAAKNRGEGAGDETAETTKNQHHQRTDGVVFHPAIDMFLREARKVTEGGNWTTEARKFVVDGFTNQLDLFLPVAKKSKSGTA